MCVALLLGEKVLSEAMGRGLGKGGLEIRPDRRPTDFLGGFKSIVFTVVSSLFTKIRISNVAKV